MSYKRILSLCLLLVSFETVFAQYDPPVKNEFRGAWIATVGNLDWPGSSGWSVETQKSDLVSKLKTLKENGINAVFFQVRTNGDALYDSDIEPWSVYLTGEEGVAPNPYWDPLTFAIDEAHKLGMELHAWLNPYRALRTVPSDFTQKAVNNMDESWFPFTQKEYDANSQAKYKGTTERDSMHVSNTHPEWLLVMKDSNGNPVIAIFDPGLPEVIEYLNGIVMDIVKRYDVDGIHFDDYFYPYPPDNMTSTTENNSLDDSTFIKYPRGFSDKNYWRRNNINMMVQSVYDSIQVAKPWVKFSISPFGIWKPGYPGGITGLNAYETIYCDALAWIEAKTIDFLVPQLYWAFGGGQDYGKLATWWGSKTSAGGIHLYPGHGLYRSDSNTYSGTTFAANEIPKQIRYNRSEPNADGSVFFRAKNITTYTSKHIRDSLQTDFYKYAALPPVMNWKDTLKPEMPENFTLTKDAVQANKFVLSWDRPGGIVAKQNSATAYTDTLLKYAIYRVDSPADPNELEEMQNPYNLIAVIGETTYTDVTETGSEDNFYYFVTSVTRNNIESTPTESQDAGFVVSVDEEPVLVDNFKLFQNYPNPFNPSTQISFNIGKTGHATLKVYDLLGREVATLVDQRLNKGTHSVSFNAARFSSGIYLYRLNTNGLNITKRMTLIK